MKRLLIFLTGIFCLISFCGCKREGQAISFYVPDGAPLINANVFFEDDKALADYRVEANLITGASVEPLILAKTPDIIAAPIVSCANSYASTNSEYVLAGVSVFGLNHIVTNSNTTLSDFNELLGEVVYSFQKNGTPSKTFIALLNMHEIPYKELTSEDKTVHPDKVNIEYLPSPAAVRNAMTVGLEGKEASFYKFGLLAEPILTASVTEGTLKRVFDLQQIWIDKEGKNYPQVGVLVRKSLVDSDKKLLTKIRDAYTLGSDLAKDNAQSVSAFLKEEVNSSELPDKTVLSSFLTSEVGKNAISFAFGEEVNESVKNYLEKINTAIPPNDFFAM